MDICENNVFLGNAKATIPILMFSGITIICWLKDDHTWTWSSPEGKIIH